VSFVSLHYLQCLISVDLFRLGLSKYFPLLIGLVTLLEIRVCIERWRDKSLLQHTLHNAKRSHKSLHILESVFLETMYMYYGCMCINWNVNYLVVLEAA